MVFRGTSSPFLALTFLAAGCLISCARESAAPKGMTDTELVERGRYLVTVLGCDDCHTPGYFYGAADTARALSGSELGWKGFWGVSYAANLTPEPQTGIGAWSENDIITAIRTGKTPMGEQIMPPMPWPDFAHLTDDDARAVAKYLKTLTPILHQVPEHIPPGGKPKGPVVEFPVPPAWDAPRTHPATP